LILLQGKTDDTYGKTLLPRGAGTPIVNVCFLIKVTGTHHGYEEKRKISLRESQMLLRD
jgi:hypothetical protein